jgi:hypothetical protein
VPSVIFRAVFPISPLPITVLFYLTGYPSCLFLISNPKDITLTTTRPQTSPNTSQALRLVTETHLQNGTLPPFSPLHHPPSVSRPPYLVLFSSRQILPLLPSGGHGTLQTGRPPPQRLRPAPDFSTMANNLPPRKGQGSRGSLRRRPARQGREFAPLSSRLVSARPPPPSCLQVDATHVSSVSPDKAPLQNTTYTCIPRVTPLWLPRPPVRDVNCGGLRGWWLSCCRSGDTSAFKRGETPTPPTPRRTRRALASCGTPDGSYAPSGCELSSWLC